MTTTKKKKMSREDAAELYKDLQRNMAKLKANGARPKATTTSPGDTANVAKQIAASIKSMMKDEPAAASRPVLEEPMMPAEPGQGKFGSYAAVALVLLFAAAKVGLSALENGGFAAVGIAQATITRPAAVEPVSFVSNSAPIEAFSKEQVKILTSLDARRVELEERSTKLDERTRDLDSKDRELAVRLTQLRELTERLKVDRDKDDKKRGAQLEQLANVYGSMNPPEAAQLLEQLDVTIALALIERMPEKRIGQILALMTPPKALAITKMLSGKATAATAGQ